MSVGLCVLQAGWWLGRGLPPEIAHRLMHVALGLIPSWAFRWPAFKGSPDYA